MPSFSTHHTATLLAGIAALVFLLLAATGGAVADTPENETDEDEDAIIHEFTGTDARLVNVDFDDSTAYVTIETNQRERIQVADAGVKSGQFDAATVYVDGRETIEVELRGTERVSVTTDTDGYTYDVREDEDLLTVVQGAATVRQIQWGTISGGLGALISLGLVVSLLRRQHLNTYRELTTEERIRVSDDPAESWVDRIGNWCVRHYRLLILAAVMLLYGLLWILRLVPGPLWYWAQMTDGMRIVFLGSLVMVVVSLLPVYLLAKRLWSPEREFVVSADSRDIIESALGANGGLKEMVEAIQEDEEADDEDEDSVGLAIYSGPPERISQMEIDGGATETRAPGGKLHVVQSFDPEHNRAHGTWPGCANDIELIAERSKIDANRELLRDESKMLRSMLSSLPAIETVADASAVRAIENVFRDSVAVDSSPVNDILQRASQGTRLEDVYQEDEDEDEEIEYEDIDEEPNPEAEQ